MRLTQAPSGATMRFAIAITIVLLTASPFLGPARAQSSSSYSIDAKSLNAGGHPAGGMVMESSSYKISLDAIGEPAASIVHSSGSFSLRGGSGAAYRPAGEVSGVAFNSKTIIAWTPHASAGTYKVYRGAIQNYLASGFGSCLGYAIELPTTTDSDPVPVGAGFFYLMTVTTPIAEEGTKGFRTGGIERSNPAPCP